jgi:hypothetical protein
MQAFRNCQNLAIEINLPNLTNLEEYAFSNCRKITKVVSLGNLTELNDVCIFEDCKSLIEVNLPNTLNRIGLGSFVNCESLAAINIPSGVTSIEDYASGITRVLKVSSSYPLILLRYKNLFLTIMRPPASFMFLPVA